MRDKRATVQDLEELPPFHSAARQGDKAQLSDLLETHPDLIDYGDGKGFTALMHAIFAKKIECVKLLLEYGGKAEVRDGKGRTALHFCARQGWAAGAVLLLKYGAKCSSSDNNGRNALHFGACSYEESCMEVLLNHAGNDVTNAVDCEGMTALHWASFHNVEENVNILLRKGANATILDHEHKTPLHWAAQNGCVSACKSLLRSKYCKLLINQRANDSKTALHLATIGGYLEVIFELAQGRGFDAEIGDKEGRTALHWACAVGSDRCVAGLLRLGVKHDVKDSYGVTPLVYAKNLNYQRCVSVLESFNPQRPHDVLIPVESLSEYSNSVEKIANHRASLSNLEQDVFLLIPSGHKEESKLERVVQLQEHSLADSQHLQSFREANDDALDAETRYSDCELNWSDDEGKNCSQATHHDTVIDIVFSEDEMRYQPQMSLTPPDGFLHTSYRPHRKKSDSKNGPNMVNKLKKPLSPYKLAPIKSYVNGSRFEVSHEKLDSPRGQKSPKPLISRKISTGALDHKQNNSHDMWMTNSLARDLPSRNALSDRPLGLRRKSLSFNDAIANYTLKTPDKNIFSRTQSYGQMTMPNSKLPMIDVRDGRNLTQQLYLHPTGFMNEIHDEVEPITIAENKVLHKKKKKAQRRDRVSRFEP